MASIPPSRSAVLRDLGRYRIHAQLAAGGMATVHLARQIGGVGFARTVAIKRLHEQYVSDPAFVSMMVDEARLASRIRHPNVVPTLDVVARHDGLFIVMEFVHGLSLARLLVGAEVSKDVTPVSVASSVVGQALRGLHAAHQATDDFGKPLKIVHRDVSPQNIMVGTDGVVRVVDFGVAKAQARVQTTENGQLKGKLGYMSPEQVRLEPVDRRTDLFAMGIVLWEILAQRRLVDAPDPAGKIAMIGNLTVPSLRALRQDVSEELEAVVLKALENDPARRFSTAEEMARALEQAAPGASFGPVSEWVLRCGEDELNRIELLVRKMEASSPGGYSTTTDVHTDIPSGVDSRPLGESGLRSFAGTEASTVVEKRELPVPEGDTLTTTTQTFPARPSSARTGGTRRLRWLVASSAVAVVGSAVWVVSSNREVAASHPPKAAALPSIGLEAPRPVAPATTVSATSAIPLPSSSAAANALLAQPKKRVSRNTPPPSSNVAKESTTRTAPSSSCIPPYVLVDGLKRYKPECL